MPRGPAFQNDPTTDTMPNTGISSEYSYITEAGSQPFQEELILRVPGATLYTPQTFMPVLSLLPGGGINISTDMTLPMSDLPWVIVRRVRFGPEFLKVEPPAEWSTRIFSTGVEYHIRQNFHEFDPNLPENFDKNGWFRVGASSCLVFVAERLELTPALGSNRTRFRFTSAHLSVWLSRIILGGWEALRSAASGAMPHNLGDIYGRVGMNAGRYAGHGVSSLSYNLSVTASSAESQSDISTGAVYEPVWPADTQVVSGAVLQPCYSVRAPLQMDWAVNAAPLNITINLDPSAAPV